jgi:hypothetical protein
MTPTTIDGMTFWTVTVKALKAAAHQRRQKLYDARHKRDAVRLISLMLAFGLLTASTTWI